MTVLKHTSTIQSKLILKALVCRNKLKHIKQAFNSKPLYSSWSIHEGRPYHCGTRRSPGPGWGWGWGGEGWCRWNVVGISASLSGSVLLSNSSGGAVFSCNRIYISWTLLMKIITRYYTTHIKAMVEITLFMT